MPDRLVVIGAGMASGRALEHLLEMAPDAYDITLFGAEPRGNYNRIMLSPVLAGEKTYADIVTHDADWYARNGVTCRFGEPVTRIDRDRKVVISAGGETPYDKLLIAAGSAPFIIPAPGKDLPGVITYRDLDDTNAMIDAAGTPGAKAVVIGGGLLGLEAAAGLKARGMDVTVLHLMGHLMERQLDPAAGDLLREDLEKRGIRVCTNANTEEIVGDVRVEAVRLNDGTEYPADLVCMAVGIRPEIALARSADLNCGRGLIVDDQMTTSDEDILAVGECTEHRGICYGLVAPLYEMAQIAASTLSGHQAAYAGSVVSTKLKVTGVEVFSAGDFNLTEDREEIVLRDAASGVYRRLVLQEDRIVGAVLYGDTRDSAWFFKQMTDRCDVSGQSDTLIFGAAYTGSDPLDPMVAVAALPDKAEICGSSGLEAQRISTSRPSPRSKPLAGHVAQAGEGIAAV